MESDRKQGFTADHMGAIEDKDIMKESDLPEWLEKEVEQKVNAEIGEEDYWGRCHTFWRVKKRILHDEYGIDWKTPAERYPTVIFD